MVFDFSKLQGLIIESMDFFKFSENGNPENKKILDGLLVPNHYRERHDIDLWINNENLEMYMGCVRDFIKEERL
jgi:hypothetical protein